MNLAVLISSYSPVLRAYIEIALTWLQKEFKSWPDG